MKDKLAYLKKEVMFANCKVRKHDINSVETLILAQSPWRRQIRLEHAPIQSDYRMLCCACAPRHKKNHKNAFPSSTLESVLHSFDKTPSKTEQRLK